MNVFWLEVIWISMSDGGLGPSLRLEPRVVTALIDEIQVVTHGAAPDQSLHLENAGGGFFISLVRAYTARA